MHMKILNPRVSSWHLGMIPEWLEAAETTKISLIEFFNHAYAHGGGWRPFKGFTLNEDNSLKYPGDPALKPFVEFTMDDRPDKVFMYDHAWVAIVQPNRSFEVCRMD